MIIDAHAHLGQDVVFDVNFTEAQLLDAQDRQGIAVTLVQPATAHDLDTVRQYHDAIGRLMRAHPGRFYGIANPNPHLPGTAYLDEVCRCIEDLGFVGVKLHPTAHAVNPLSDHGRRVFALAAELEAPVMVHTGSGIPWAAPSLLAPIAEEHPELSIILAHSGMMVLAGEAGLLAATHPNVYLECSWTGGHLVRQWVRKFGAHRVLFGADHAENAATEICKIRTCGITEEEAAWVLGHSARAVFRLPVSEDVHA